MNARAVERLAALLATHRVMPRFRCCVCGAEPMGRVHLGDWHRQHMVATIVAAGWGHPDDLTDEQIQVTVGYGGYWKSGGVRPLEQRAGDFRAALARAFKEET